MSPLIELLCLHIRHTMLALIRAGGGPTVVSTLAALGLLVPVVGRQGAEGEGSSMSAALALALLAATASTMVHTVVLVCDPRRLVWEQYLTLLPGYAWSRRLAFIVAACVLGLLAALPVTLLGLVHETRPDAATWSVLMALIPVAAVPGLLLGLLLAEIRSVRGRRMTTAVLLLALTSGALVAVGSHLPSWAQLLSRFTPTFAASRTLIPVMNQEPLSTPHLGLWVLWCLCLLSALVVLHRHRHRHRSLP